MGETTTPTTKRTAWREAFLREALAKREAIKAEGRFGDARNLAALAVALERSAGEDRNVHASHSHLRRAGRLSSTAFRLCLRQLIEAGLVAELDDATTLAGVPVIHINDTTTTTGAIARDHHNDH